MSVFVYTARVDTSGPLYDGTAPGIIRDGIHHGLLSVGEYTADMVRDHYDAHHVRPSKPPYARSRIRIIDRFPRIRIGDGGIIYGPWLEGVGSRNATTRFKGYAHYRQTAARVRVEGVRIFQAVMTRYVRRIGGR